ncbi:hypothetical protein [Sphingobacterium sp. 1.A.4]|uniref:hypothetical protein n=1 Tax=Sphingobacterium sp. 1.A.4 TaxID=2044603 RepID=UPI000C0BCFB4|nr:hypothetical protein [Sphingobacterium sp. 1.A.4]
MNNIKTVLIKISLILLALTLILAKHYKESKRFTIVKYEGRYATDVNEEFENIRNKELTQGQYEAFVSSLGNSYMVNSVIKSTVITYKLFDFKQHGLWINLFLLISMIGIIICFVPTNRLSLLLVVVPLLYISYFQKEDDISKTNNSLAYFKSQAQDIELKINELSDEISNLRLEID